MWVVKLGGSLNDDPVLLHWLELLSNLGGGRVTLVCGGGRFADQVRAAQQRWQFDDLAAHNMAVLAMAQSAYQAQALRPALQLAASEHDIRRTLHRGRCAVWLPLSERRTQPDADTSWEVSSDSLALGLAQRLNAERLVLVKSCPVSPRLSLADYAARGVLDLRFPQLAESASCAIDLLHKSELQCFQDRLLGVTV